MKILYLFIFSVFFISCNKKDIRIPVNDNSGINEVWDNSKIYILMRIEGKDTLAGLKMGQIISTTHWLTAVDKRLHLKNLLEPIQKIIKKRHKKTIHYQGGKHAYFAYLDSVNKKVAFIDFDSIQIISDFYTSGTYFKKYGKSDENFNKFHLKIYRKQLIFNDSIIFNKQFSKDQIHQKIWNYIAKRTTRKNNRLYLSFDRNINFDRFLNYYTFFKINPIPKGKMSNTIFIFNPKDL